MDNESRSSGGGMARWVWLVLFVGIAAYRLYTWSEGGAPYDLLSAVGFVLLAFYSFQRPAAVVRPHAEGAGGRAGSRMAALGIVALGLIIASFVWRMAVLA